MHIIHGELRKPPFIKNGCGQDQQSTMFIIELAEVVKERDGSKSYTNYSAAIFAKSPAQINHYGTTLVEGNFVVVTGEKLKVDVSESNGKQYIKLQVENARLEGSGYTESQQQQQPAQGGYQQERYQQPAQGGFQQRNPQQQQAHDQSFQQQAPRNNEHQGGYQGGQQQMRPK